MNRDDIIRMAREAGLIHFYDSEGHCTGITDAPLITENLDRNDSRLVEMLAPFAALVAAAEREACAVDVEQAGMEGYGTLAAALLVRERGAP